jgi:hypothetical protein
MFAGCELTPPVKNPNESGENQNTSGENPSTPEDPPESTPTTEPTTPPPEDPLAELQGVWEWDYSRYNFIISGTNGYISKLPDDDADPFGVIVGKRLQVDEKIITDIKQTDESTFNCKVTVVFNDVFWEYDAYNNCMRGEPENTFKRQIFNATITSSQNNITINIDEGQEPILPWESVWWRSWGNINQTWDKMSDQTAALNYAPVEPVTPSDEDPLVELQGVWERDNGQYNITISGTNGTISKLHNEDADPFGIVIGERLKVGETIITDIKKTDDCIYSCKFTVVFNDVFWEYDAYNSQMKGEPKNTFTRETFDATIKGTSGHISIKIDEGQEPEKPWNIVWRFSWDTIFSNDRTWDKIGG